MEPKQYILSEESSLMQKPEQGAEAQPTDNDLSIPMPVTIAAPVKSAKGERVRAQQEAGEATEAAGPSLPGVDTATLDTLSVQLGYGPGERVEYTYAGRTFVMRPFSYDDMDMAFEAMPLIPIYFLGIAMTEPGKPVNSLTIEQITMSINKFRKPEDIADASETAFEGVTLLLGALSKEAREAMLKVIYLAFKREENQFGRTYRIEDVKPFFDLTTFPLMLRQILQKNVLLMSRFLD